MLSNSLGILDSLGFFPDCSYFSRIISRFSELFPGLPDSRGYLQILWNTYSQVLSYSRIFSHSHVFFPEFCHTLYDSLRFFRNHFDSLGFCRILLDFFWIPSYCPGSSKNSLTLLRIRFVFFWILLDSPNYLLNFSNLFGSFQIIPDFRAFSQNILDSLVFFRIPQIF